MGAFVRGGTGATGLVIATTVYRAVGRFGEGMVLRRVRVGWGIAGTASIAIALVLASADEETAANLKAGRSLITRSDASIVGIPAVSFSATADSSGVFDLFWGLPLLASERYVVLGLTATPAGAAGSAVFSVEMLARA